VKDAVRYVRTIVDELIGAGVARRDAMQNHPQEDGTVDPKQEIRTRSRKNIPPAISRVGPRHLPLVVRDGMRGPVAVVQRYKFAFRLGGARHGRVLYAIVRGKG
jgi:hypothetical protein